MESCLNEASIEFVSFCIENFKVKHNQRGKAIIELFDKADVINFLIDNYEILHTQGKDYILSEIEIYLKNRGYSI